MIDVDTIAAVSTAPGVGAISVVRMSGPRSADILCDVAPSLGAVPEPRSQTLVEIVDGRDGERIDRALATYFQAPASYTGEDMVEIACHGGWLVPQLVLDALLRAGARGAEAGEFTRRAYLNGKMDLVQAEAVADVIEARSRAFHRAALAQLERGLSERLATLKEALLDLEALLVHHIDFPEEDDVPVPLHVVGTRALEVAERLEVLLRTAPEGELVREGALVVLAGRPNAGKSSLYNALLGEERAIVTPEPGTTRDALEAVVQIAGFPFRLVDTAGLRESDEAVERLGIEVARRYLSGADVILLCVPAREGLDEVDLAFSREVAGRPVVLVETMADRARPEHESGHAGEEGASGGVAAARVRTSVVTGEGLAELRETLPRVVFSTLTAMPADAPVVTRRRQADALRQARDEVLGFADALGEGVPPEVAASHLRAAATQLEGLLGLVSIEDVLDVVFRRFCVGK